jgi:hypothetical protein
MLKRFLVVAVLIAALMVGLKNGTVLKKAGLTGSCTVVQTSADAQVNACRAGRLEGRPNLSKHSCVSTGMKGTYEYWRCPAAVVASQVGR